MPLAGLAIALTLAASDTTAALHAPRPPASSHLFSHQRAARPARPFRGWRRFAGWTLFVTGDPFAARTTCTVTASGMEYARGVLTVRFGPRVDTFDAVYRIDDGPSIKASSNALAIAHEGFQIYQDNLASPSGGLIRIPGAQVAGAREVRIELCRSGHVFLRRLAGLGVVLDAAHQYRCDGF